MVAIHVDDNGTLARLQELRQRTGNPREMMMACGRELSNQLKQHYQIRDRNQSNKLGGKRGHFWLQIAQSVQNPTVSGDALSASVDINDPRIAQKVFGGPIKAKNVDALTIPQTPDAYGRSAATFEQETGLKLFLVKTAHGVGLAVSAENSGITVEYILTPSVIQDKDPDALPRTELLQAAIEQRAAAVVDRQNRDAGFMS
jgi:hypothetical protein